MNGMSIVRSAVIWGALALASVAAAQSATTPAAPTQDIINITPFQWRPVSPDAIRRFGLQVPLNKFVFKRLVNPPVQGFSVVLVLADMQNPATPDNVPEGARKALADLKDFLPYKSYRLLDTAWVLSAAPTNTVVTLRGPGNNIYEVTVGAELAPGGQPGASGLRLRFLMTDGDGVEIVGSGDRAKRLDELGAELAELAAKRADLEGQIKSLRERVGERHPDVLRARAGLAEVDARIASAKSQSRSLSGGGKLIDTTFNMDVGETVVVGTSRTGDSASSALVALLTAVPKVAAK